MRLWKPWRTARRQPSRAQIFTNIHYYLICVHFFIVQKSKREAALHICDQVHTAAIQLKASCMLAKLQTDIICIQKAFYLCNRECTIYYRRGNALIYRLYDAVVCWMTSVAINRTKSVHCPVYFIRFCFPPLPELDIRQWCKQMHT